MKTTLKRLLCLVLSVMFFTMSLPVLAADETQEPTTTETTETNLPGLDLLETLNPTKVEYGYVIVAKDPDKTKNELTWDDFKKALDDGNVSMSAKILLKTDVNLNENFTFKTTEGSGEVIISWGNNSVKVGVDGKTTVEGNTGYWANIIKNQYDRSINSWTPIGTENAPFQGVFNAFEYDDENGNIIGMYDISGLMFNADTDNVGLFGVVDKGAIIAGVRVINSYVRGTNDVGAIVGNSKHGANIIGCVNGTGSIVIGEENVGGVVGSFDVDHGDSDLDDDSNQDHIYECVNRGYVYGTENVGGIVGYTYHALIRNSFNMHADTEVIVDNTTVTDAQADEEKIVHTGYVEGTTYVGGIVGHAVSTVIYGCTNYGVVTGYDSTDENENIIPAQYVGGIVGKLDQVRSYLREVVNAGSATVTGKEYVGGIVGYLGETDGKSAGEEAADLELFMAYNHGTVNGTDKVGGLVGYNATRGKVFNSYSKGPVVVEQEEAETKNANNGNIVGVNNGQVRDCFYYPNLNTNTKNAIGNGIGNGKSYTGRKIHVVGLTVDALKSEAAAYLLNLVYLENDDHSTGAGYHHLATHDFGDTAWTTPTYWMAGNKGPEFTESTSLAAKTIKSASLTLNENFNLTFKVYVPNGLSTEVIRSRQVTVYQEGTKLEIGDTISATYKTDKDANGNERYYYEFTLTDIKPHYLGDKFEVIFTAKYAIPQIQDDGTEKALTENDYISVSEKREYSVQDYCERQLAKKPTDLGYTGEDDERYIRLRTLLCNVLEYGAVYQDYRKHTNASGTLPNVNFEKNGWTATHYWNNDNAKPNGEIHYSLNTEPKNPEFYLYASMIRFGSENMLGVWIYIENIDLYTQDRVIVKVDNKEFRISDLQKHTSLEKVYKLAAIPVSITTIGTEYEFKLYPDINQEHTESIKFSMEAFITSLINNPDGREKIAAALWDYYYAAKLYAEGDKVAAPDDTTGDITLGDNIWDKDVWENIKDESNKGTNIDADGDGIPDSWVKLNISSSVGNILSIFNSWLREWFTLELIQYQDAWYARPSDVDWSQWDTNA